MTCVVVVSTATLLSTGCSMLPIPRTSSNLSGRVFTTDVQLHGRPLELHLSTPRAPLVSDTIVLYASGDGGWFGAAVDMFDRIAAAGYPAVGFSSRAFLRIERPHGALVSATQLAAEYERIVDRARVILGIPDRSRVVLTGWSRGAALSVLVGTVPSAKPNLLGVIAIGLPASEDLLASNADDESREPSRADGRSGQFDTYASTANIAPLACAVIQSTHDGYLPAAEARALFGADNARRRFYAIDARNHRFSGGRAAFNAALLDAIGWVASEPGRREDNLP